MALRFIDGFDYYATADLASRYNIVGGSFQIVAAIGRFGSGALRNATAGGNERLIKFFDNQQTWIVGVAYKFSLGGVATRIISFLASNGNSQLELGMNTSNQLVITKNNGGTTLVTGTTTLLTGTFYYIEFKGKMTTSTASGDVQVKLNSVVEATVAAAQNTDPQSTSGATRVSLHYDQFQNQNTYDDLYICDGTGSVNNTFLGDMRVETLLPSAQGNYADFAVTGGTGGHYGAVNETAQNGDTSYVSSSTVTNRESYVLPDLSSTPVSIAGVQIVTIARKDDAGARAITPFFRESSTNYDGTQRGLADTYVYLTEVFQTNPATSAAWTGTEVNAVEVGFQLTA